MTITFYYQPNILRTSEAAFFDTLITRFPDAVILNAHYYVPENTLNQFLDAQKIIGWLQRDRFIPLKKRQACIQILKEFPSDSLRIAFRPSEISFDFVGIMEGKVHYWEFHEKQHVRLSVDRIKRVYTPEGQGVEVPRFFQRLMRDLWRISYFQPYTMVWKDWFESDESSKECLEFRDGLREYYLEEKFSFLRFVTSSKSYT